ncbi:DUF420 domain-containing protein [Halovivax sp.]|uniref:DUF420 domain-containing protein n=1 Tax=Halovivax sp. TaxID=1935978 RepID=UPI0025C02A98|nr:DUF420 domain-containing protein [Halovivax sp.]
MRLLTADRVPAATAALTLVSLTLVFGAAGGFVPSSTVPTAPEVVLGAIPTVNVAVSALAIATIAHGWRQIRRGRVDRHRRAMVVSVALFAIFLVLYLYRLVAIGGATGFDGPAAIHRYVYLPLLTGHVGLAVVCIPLLYYALLLAGAHGAGNLAETHHARVGRIAAPLWITSFALGILVYLLLHVVY